MIKRCLPLLALGLAACSPPPPTIQFKIKYLPAKIVPECLTDEPQWAVPDPKQDETRSQASWRDHQNHGAFQSLSDDHETCKASLTAQKDPKSHG